jgi:dihydroflavonol-4-reductase
MTRVLVTGGAGFLGRHLCAALAAAGHAVVALDVGGWPEALPGVRVVRGSILDSGALADAMAGASHVAHLAAYAMLWARRPADFTRVNVDGARAVAQAAAQAGVARFLHVSSATTLVAGPRGEALLTAEDVQPVAALLGPYPRSKRAGELAVAEALAGRAALVSALPTVPIGPGDINRTAPARLLAELAAGGPPAILDTLLDLVDVRDLAATLARALFDAPAGTRWLMGGQGVRLSALAALVDQLEGRVSRPRPRIPYALALAAAHGDEAAARLTGRPPRASLTGVRIAGRERRFDSGPARAALGHALRPLEATLADALAWLGAYPAAG